VTFGERKKGNCRYCGKAGHWAKECRKAKRDRERGIAANLAEVEGEEESSLLAVVDCIDMQAAPGGVAKRLPPSAMGEHVYLNEEHARVEPRQRHRHGVVS
jgi:hypothetical protein